MVSKKHKQNIDIASYRLQKTSSGKIALERGAHEIDPIGPKEIYSLPPEEQEPLSQIIRELNEHFGTGFTEEDKLCIKELEERLADNTALEASVRVISSLPLRRAVSILLDYSLNC